MPLIKDGEAAQDPWVFLDDAAPAAAEADVVVSVARLKEEAGALAARSGRLGVVLRPDEGPEDVVAHLASLSLVAIEFPAFTDGRGYSSARMLRERHRFAGEIRAIGNVLRDQILFMTRCGVDAFDIDRDDAVEIVKAALSEQSVFTQFAADSVQAVWAQRRQRSKVAAE